MNTALSAHDQAVLNSVFNPSLPLDEAYNEELSDNLQDAEDNFHNSDVIKRKEIEAIEKAESKNYEAALNLLNEAITEAPGKPSLYNNRAQIFQFMNSFKEALSDLSQAVRLADPNHQRTLCQALCQRGLIYRRNDEVNLAREDFIRASCLGSKFAKSQLVAMNPYAALCNQMLRKVMDELK